MSLKTTLLAASVAISGACLSQGALVAHWNFNSFDPTTATSIPSDSGTATINLLGFTGDINNFAGTTENAVGTDESGASLSLVGEDGNASHIDVSFATIGLTDIVMTFATRGTGTGYNSGLWSYSVDNVVFTDTGAGNTTTNTATWLTRTVDLTSITAAEDVANLTLRYTVDGATSGGGNNRLDNVQINAIPEPSTALLGGLGLLALLRRRR